MKLTIESEGCVLVLNISAQTTQVIENPELAAALEALEPEKPAEAPVQEPEKPSETPVQEPEKPSETPVQEPEKPSETPVQASEEPAEAPEAPVQEPAVDAGKMLGELVKAAANAAKTGKKRLAQKLIKDFGGETLGDVPGDKQVELLQALKDLT